MLGLQLITRLLRLLREQRGGVALLFGLCALPLAMIVGLAVDFSFYIQVKAQVNLAADAAAMHAVSVASRAYAAGTTTMAGIQAAGQAAGQQWFAAQLGALTNGTVSPGNVTVVVNYNTTPSGFTAAVSYTGTVATHFGGLFHVATFPISGGANAAISNPQVEVLMMFDNSPSMLIGATADDMLALQQATVCSTVGAPYNHGHPMTTHWYSWNYTGNSGYSNTNTAPPATQNGSCDSRYTGDPRLCAYIATYPNVSPSNTYKCTNPGGGTPLTIQGINYPNAPNPPCAFACHSDAGNNDYFGVARANKITLRLDVVLNAAAQMITTLQNKQEAPGQFSVGIYSFDTGLARIYPPASTEAGTDLAAALTAVQNAKNTPLMVNGTGGYTSQNTDFQSVAGGFSGYLAPAGDGSTAAKAKKSLFILSDGVEDKFTSNGSMVSSNGTADGSSCDPFWSKGIDVYVLYTPYLPLPAQDYFGTNMANTEPMATSQIINGLKACARTTSHFFQASDAASINIAMTNMLNAALNAPGRVAN